MSTTPPPAPAPVPAARPAAAVPPPPAPSPPHAGPRRGALVAALVVAVALLVGSVGVAAAWVHDGRGPFASERAGIERFDGPRSGNGWVRPGPGMPGMPGRMFDRPGGRHAIPQPPARPTPSPSPSAGY